MTLSLWERKLAHPPLPPLLPPLLLHLGSPLSREPSGLLPRIAVRRGAAGGWKNTLKKMKKRSTIKTLLRLVKHSINSVLILFPCLPSCYMLLARFFFFLGMKHTDPKEVALLGSISLNSISTFFTEQEHVFLYPLRKACSGRLIFVSISVFLIFSVFIFLECK